jgi:hypothetical protein
MNDRKKYVCRRKRDREKKNETNFFFCLLAKYSIRLLSYIYIYIVVTERKLKKSGKKRRVVFNDNTTIFLYCVCVFVFSILSLFFSVCVRAFGVCKYITESESRQIEKREKRGKKSWGRKRMGNTRTLLCFLDVDNSEGRREKGNGTKGEEQKQKRRATNHWKNNLRERKEKQSRLEMCIDVEYVQKKMHTNTYSSYL